MVLLVLGRFDPLWNSLVVGGLAEGKPFLGMVGMLGTHYSDEHVATGEHPFHIKICRCLTYGAAICPEAVLVLVRPHHLKFCLPIARHYRA